MDPKIQVIFEPLRVAIENEPYTAADLMSFLGNLVDVDPAVARAACLHASDIFHEPQGGKTFSWVITEIYRRTFFDAPYAALYGTTKLLDRGEDTLKQMVEHLLAGLAMEAAVMVAEASSRNH